MTDQQITLENEDGTHRRPFTLQHRDGTLFVYAGHGTNVTRTAEADDSFVVVVNSSMAGANVHRTDLAAVFMRKAVRWGEETTDEMCIAFLAYTVDDENLAASAKAASSAPDSPASAKPGTISSGRNGSRREYRSPCGPIRSPYCGTKSSSLSPISTKLWPRCWSA